MIHYMVNMKPGGPTARTGPKADWKFVGGVIPPGLFDQVIAEAKEQGVSQVVILRWALDAYLNPGRGDGS